LKSCDAILSPDKPFFLGPTAFHGFPIGSCAEAALCRIALFCTGLLSFYLGFRDREELVLVPPEAGAIFAILEESILTTMIGSGS
jgi:hypothetical protein